MSSSTNPFQDEPQALSEDGDDLTVTRSLLGNAAPSGESDPTTNTPHVVNYSTSKPASDAEAQNQGRPNIAGATFNLLNAIVGVGILGLPYVFTQVGLVFGFVLIAIISLGTGVSFWFLLQASDLTRQKSYEELANHTLGFVPSIVTKIIIILDTFGSLSAFLVVIADSTYQFIASHVEHPQQYAILDRAVLLALSLVIIIPLSLLRRINLLAFTSFLSLLPLVYLLVLQIVLFGIMKSEDTIVGTVPWVSGGFLVALPIVVFAFSSQIQLFPIYTEMHEKHNGTSSDMMKVVKYSIAFTIFSYGLCGLFGILTFPTTASGNILLNYKSSIAIDILLVSMIVSVILGYPLTVFPCRESIDRLFFSTRQASYARLCVITFLIITVTYTIAALIPSFSAILGLSGALTKTAIGYVLPPLFYIRAKPGALKRTKSKIMALIVLIVGAAAGIASAIATIVEYAQKGQSDIPQG